MANELLVCSQILISSLDGLKTSSISVLATCQRNGEVGGTGIYTAGTYRGLVLL